MPLTREALPAFRQALMLLMIVVYRIVLSFIMDVRALAGVALDRVDERLEPARRPIGHAIRTARTIVDRIPRPTRAEIVTFALMFSLGANLVTVIAVMEYAT